MILMSTGPLRNQSYKMKIEPSLESPEVWHKNKIIHEQGEEKYENESMVSEGTHITLTPKEKQYESESQSIFRKPYRADKAKF